MKKVLIIANPVSGKGKAANYSEELAEVLVSQYKATIEKRVTQKPRDAYEWSKGTSRDDFDSIICLGGDGTVNEVISGLMENPQSPHFAFLPLGTVNDLARSLGISLNPEQAIQQFRSLELKKLDIGKVNDQYFVNVLALGAIPSAVLETESKIKNKIGVLAYLFDGFKAMFQEDKFDLNIIVDGKESFQVETNLLLLTLTSSVGGADNILPKEQLFDGLGHLYVFKGSVAQSTIATLIEEKGLPNLKVNNDSLLSIEGQSFEIKSNKPLKDKVRTNLDGDKGPSLPLNIRIYGKTLSTWVPKAEKL